VERAPSARRTGRRDRVRRGSFGAYVPSAGERVCVVLSGTNCDPTSVIG
jgi:hypothetical protein